MDENQDIRNKLNAYKISYSELLKYIPNFSHIQRISEELSKPLTKERKEVYLSAIEKVLEEKRNFYEKIGG